MPPTGVVFADSQALASPEGPVALSPEDWRPPGREPLPGTSGGSWVRVEGGWAVGEEKG